MTYDSKMDALNVQTNVHVALNLLRNGSLRVVQRVRAYTDSDNRLAWFNDSTAYRGCFRRDWHAELQNRFRLHPAIDKLLGEHRPLDWHQLVLEFPHQAESDRNRVAYTQNEDKGQRDIQTVTSLGKYITRHFPQLPDHEVRNVVASHTVMGCKIVRTIAEMINVLQRGPHSCMRWGDGEHVDIDTHPYKCYDPRLGWGMAVREEGGEVVGRALVYERDGRKLFVRTYMRPTNASNYSQADDNLNAWLRDQGYTHESNWEGCLLAYYDGRYGNPLAPYLDGDVKDVDVVHRDDNKYLLVREGGEYRCENTDGSVQSGGDTCNDCGDRIDEGDGYWVGADEDEIVCQHCCDHNYYYGYGRRGRQYYIHESNIVSVGDEVYDESYISDNEIVCLKNGDYCHTDDAVFVESDDEYYHCDDEAVCYDDYNNRYELRDDCVELADGSMCHSDDAWMCEATGDYYSDDDLDERVEVDGKYYHQDNAPEQEETTETTGE